MPHLQISLLGSITVSVNEQPIHNFYSDKVRALFAYLVVEADTSITRQQLMGLLWPDVDDKSARASLRQALYHLRRAVGDKQATPPYLIATTKTVQWNRNSDYTLDVQQFDDALNMSNGQTLSLHAMAVIC